jgi:hypothetical protein
VGELVERLEERSPLDLSATVGLDQAYDSNVFNGRGPDLVTRLTPRLAVALHDRRYDLKASYDLGLWHYLEGKANNSINHRALLGVDLRLTHRLELQVADELVRAEDPGFLVRAGVVAPQTGITDNITDVLADYRLTRRWDLLAGYTFRLTHFDPQPPGQLPLHDGDEHAVTVAGAWRATRVDDLRFSHRFQYFTADGAGLAVGNSPGAGWRHQLTRDVELRAEAGPMYYQGLQATAGGTSGWTWRGQAVVRWYTPGWRAAISYVHDLVGGTGAATVLWADWVYAQLGYHFAERLDVHGGVGVFANGLAPSGDRLYDGVNVDLIVDTRLMKNLRLAAYYSFRWQEATAGAMAFAPIEPVTRNIVGVRLFAVFGAEARPPRREVHP